MRDGLVVHGRPDGGVVVGDLPLAVDLAPDVGEAGFHCSSVALVGAKHEGVHARVEVCISAEGLDLIISDSAEGVLLDELSEVALRACVVLDEVARHSGEEGQLVGSIAGGVEGGDGHVIPGLEGVVPDL